MRPEWRPLAAALFVTMGGACLTSFWPTSQGIPPTPYHLAHVTPQTPADYLLLGHPIDLATANAAILETLPGIGPMLAGRIIAWRHQHGAIHTPDALLDVHGIGPKLLANIRPFVRGLDPSKD